MLERNKILIIIAVMLKPINASDVNNTSCSKSDELRIPLVVGGDETNIAQFPHSVYLAIRCAGDSFVCSSSILNQWILLTAAHCVDICLADRDDDIMVLAGHEDLYESIIHRTVLSYILHGSYKPDPLIHDIALIRITSGLVLHDKVKRVMITSHFPDVTSGYMAGWGVVKEPKTPSFYLKYVKQVIRSKETCAKALVLYEGIFCAGHLRAKTDHPSFGDSGSALVSDEYHQIGILSQRQERYKALMFYTNVSYYYSWIVEKSGKLMCHVV